MQQPSFNFQPLYVFIRDDTVLAFLTFIQNKQKTRQQLLIRVHTGSYVCSRPLTLMGYCLGRRQECECVCGDVCLAFCVGFSGDI